MVVRSVNIHDNQLFNESFTNLLEICDSLLLDTTNSYFVLDSAFDSIANKIELEKYDFIPVIKPNLRGTKNREKIYQRLDEFESVKHIYKERYKIEKTFAWEDTYRKLVIRYEKLQCTFIGFRYLAYSMINLRWILGKNQ